MGRPSEQLEQIDRAAQAIPVPEEVYPGGDSHLEDAEPSDEELDAKDRELRTLKQQVEQMQEALAKLVAKGELSPEEAAEKFDEHEIELARRRIYDRVKKAGNKCRIVIFTHQDIAQNKPVPVGVNGHLRYLPRGKAVEVTASELEVLDHAEYIAEEKIVDPLSGNPTLIRSRRQSYPFQIVDHNVLEG